MQRIDPFRLPRPERKTFTRIFDADGVTVELVFRKPDAADMNRAAETARTLVCRYITGFPEDGTPPCDFFDEIKVSESYFVLCASAEEMQPPEARLYSAEDFAVMLNRLPTDGPRIAAFVRELQQDWRAQVPNSRGVPTDSSAAEHSTSPTGTSSPSSEPISSSTPSTAGSALSARGSEPRTPART